MWLPIIALVSGIVIGLSVPYQLPIAAAKYLSIAILAALDSVFGGVRSVMEDSFDTGVFVTGFFGNALLAALLAYIGDRLGVNIYMAAIFAFGVRLFQNLAIIRRYLLEKYRAKER
jgi:small basic protein